MPIIVDYEKLWADYWGDAQRYGPSHRIHRFILLKTLSRLRFQNVLDVGCGNGVNLISIRQKWPKIRLSGIDCSSNALRVLNETIPEISTFKLDIRGECLPDRFDLVLCFDVLEHLDDDVAAIKNLAKMSQKYVFISTLQGRMRGFEKEIGHVRNYQPGELQEKIKQAGLNIISVVEWGWPIYSPLYRDYLDKGGGQQHTFGQFGMIRRLACHVIYWVFRLNSFKKGDMIFVLAEKS